MNTECIVLTPRPRQLSNGTKVQVDAVDTRHILVSMNALDAARFYTAFGWHVETSYGLDPRERFLVFYSPNDFPTGKLDRVVQELCRWIEEWLENDRPRHPKS